MSHIQHKHARALALANQSARHLRDKPDAFHLVQRHLILTSKHQPNLAHALIRLGARAIAAQQET